MILKMLKPKLSKLKQIPRIFLVCDNVLYTIIVSKIIFLFHNKKNEFFNDTLWSLCMAKLFFLFYWLFLVPFLSYIDFFIILQYL